MQPYPQAVSASAITVAASDASDRRASFSNFGSCVDMFAPGVGVQSSYIGSPTATAFLSGTSMASPHVAGAAALLLQAHPGYDVAQVTNVLKARATPDKIIDPAGSPNLLLYTAGIDGGTRQSRPQSRPVFLQTLFMPIRPAPPSSRVRPVFRRRAIR